MSAESDYIQRKAAEAIVRVGRSVTFNVVTSGGVYNSSTGAVSTETVTSYTVTASPLLSPRRYFREDTTRPGDASLILPHTDSVGAALSFTPAIGQEIDIGSETWTVVEAKHDDYQDAIVVWTLLLRKGGVQ